MGTPGNTTWLVLRGLASGRCWEAVPLAGPAAVGVSWGSSSWYPAKEVTLVTLPATLASELV